MASKIKISISTKKQCTVIFFAELFCIEIREIAFVPAHKHGVVQRHSVLGTNDSIGWITKKQVGFLSLKLHEQSPDIQDQFKIQKKALNGFNHLAYKNDHWQTFELNESSWKYVTTYLSQYKNRIDIRYSK